MQTWPALLLLVAVHLGGSHLPLLDRIPRARWLSLAGGASVAFVFLHLLPRLADLHLDLPIDHPVHLVALAGLGTFYGVERRLRRHDDGTATPGLFWLHVGTFSVYNALAGYLLGSGAEPVVLFTGAMALHFLVTDHGLRRSHPDRYRRRGRWVASAGIVLGWAVGAATELHPVVVAVPTAVLAGGIVLNVLKEELPRERESRFGAFAAGLALYAVPSVWP